jgi:hypothetical protein
MTKSISGIIWNVTLICFFSNLLLDSRAKDQISYAKGQLFSECLFDILNFPKNQRKFDKFLPQESKKSSNHKIKAFYNVFNT